MTSPEPMTWWLDSEGGRVLIGPASVLVGRSPDCDIVIPDARMSRHHALFRTTDEGVEVLPFGRQPVTVNGESRAAPTALRAGDRVDCLGHTFEIVETRPSQPRDPDVLWGVERSAGALFRITQSPFRIGGAADDHLIIMGWPPTVLLLHRVGNGLSLEAAREGVTFGAALAPGECVRAFHQKQKDTPTAVGQDLLNHATLASRLRDRLAHDDEEFDPSLIDEALLLAARLTAATVPPPPVDDAADTTARAAVLAAPPDAYALRTRLLRLLSERVGLVRRGARRVFVKHPEVLAEVTSAYERERRAENRRASAAKKPAHDDPPDA